MAKPFLRLIRVKLFCLGFFVFGMSWGPMVLAQEDATAPEADPDLSYSSILVLTRAMELIRQEYVDQGKTGFKSLAYSALKGMLSDLDPHSQFMDPEAFQGMQEETKSEFGGIGVTISTKSNTLMIISVLEGSPGFRAGLMPGDRILRVNGVATDRIPIVQSLGLLRGHAGEKIALTTYRPATRITKEFHLVRVVIKLRSVKDAQILSQAGRKIGYIRITQFSEPTGTELKTALEKLKKEKMEALILDLRYNPGGLLTSAVDVCSFFLPPKTLVVSTVGRIPPREYYTSKDGGAYRELPIIVLINYASASGSEIVAGALKDLHQAILLGETTFGKGSVQSVVSLPDGSAIRLTTAKYYTPSWSLIHEHGVVPQIIVPLSYSEETALLQARRDHDDSFTDGTNFHLPEDPQLNRAKDALAGYLIFRERDRPKFL